MEKGVLLLHLIKTKLTIPIHFPQTDCLNMSVCLQIKKIVLKNTRQTVIAMFDNIVE